MRCLFALVEHATLLFPAPGRAAGGASPRSRPSSARRRARGLAHEPLVPRRLVFTSLRAIVTQGYFADPAVLRALGLAPFAIETPVSEADALYPPIGRPKSAIRFSPRR